MTTERNHARTPPSAPRHWSPAWRIAGIYGIFATLWIYFSDRALGLLGSDPDLLMRWSVYKGIGFVLATAALLLWLMRRALGELERSNATLRAHEKELERLSRLYAALSQVNQAIVVTRSRDELLLQVCRMLVEHGGFRMAWIGWNDPATHRLVPVAVWGDENDYVKNIQVFSDERPEGQGPSGRAFRAKRPYVCNDILHDPATLAWRAEITRRGFRASVALPIEHKNRVVAVLSVYANEPDFFQDKELALLVKAAGDVSFGLENFAGNEERREAEARAENERLFSEAMIDSMPGILYFYDLQGRFLRWNRNFETVSGYSGGEIAEMHPRDFFAPGDRPAVEARIAEVFTQGEADVEAPFLAKDGRATPYFFTGRRVVFNDRTCLVGVGIDISERKRTEAALYESLARFHAAARATNDVVWDWDLATQTIWWNDNFRTHFGYRAEEIEPGIESWTNRLHPEDRERVLQRIHAVIADTSQVWADEYRFRRSDGSFAEVFDRGLVLRDETGRGVRMVGAILDITERKRAERAIRELNASLERRVVERTEELQAAMEQAKAADLIKSAFLATMSHELRTPLNSIIGFTGIVLQGLAGPLNAEQAKQLGMVRGSARHLLDLINDVLDISKIEAGQLEVRAEPFDLPALLERVTASVKPLADKKGLTLTAVVAPALGQMVNDRRRVEQVLLNLLNNAVKFTERGGVTLTAELVTGFRRSPDLAPAAAVRLAVADTGIGIKAEDTAKLFQPFRQIDSGLARSHEGTGLGLAICRRLAVLMGGEISVASEWTRGSVFVVTLPLQKPPAP